MQERPFEKINVAMICDKCEMNRKSFYYHFRDKYDLVNWIFDSEFLPLAARAAQTDIRDSWGIIEEVCTFFYDNRSFYRKALQITGQNSLAEHMREYLAPLLTDRFCHLTGADNADAFTVNFYTDAIFCTLMRWLQNKDCLPPQQFVGKLKNILAMGGSIADRINK